MIASDKILINYTSWVYDFTNRYMTALRGHKYHILPVSPSPLLISIALLIFLLTLVFNFHGSKIIINSFDHLVENGIDFGNRKIFGNLGYYYSNVYFNIGNKIFRDIMEYSSIHLFWISPFLVTLGIFFMWSSNAIIEGSSTKISFFSFRKNIENYAGKLTMEPMFHTNLVRKGFKIGFILFIISEIMFFFGFFWGFFHSSISPTIQIGAVWPPIDVEFITVKGFAIANTVILLTSGATLTIAHYAFELIPQKKNKLEIQEINFTESEENFTGKLTNIYGDLSTSLYDSSKPEIYKLPKFSQNYEVSNNYSFLALPIKLLISPFEKHFNWNFSLKDTEITIKLYINLMLDLTLMLAILFMIFQGTEYFISPVNINTGVYGSTFYMITGLHGAHVFIGTCFLFYCRTAVSPAINLKAIFYYMCSFLNLLSVQVSNLIERFLIEIPNNEKKSVETVIEEKETNIETIEHYGKFGIESFESAAWYWHFVDVVWIFVFGFVYVWSHLTVLTQQ